MEKLSSKKRKKDSKSKTQNKLTMQKIRSSFKGNMNSLEIFIKNVAPIAEEQDTSFFHQIEEILERTLNISPDKKTKIKKSATTHKKGAKKFDNAQISKFLQEMSKLPRLSTTQLELLYRSSFVMMISYLDFLISDLIHLYYNMYPDILSGKELGITLSELKEFGGVDDAVNYVINKEADNVLYESLDKQKDYFISRLKIDTKDKLINWDIIKEATERRNIIVHNNCKINRRYLAKIDELTFPGKKTSYKEGEDVHVNEEYFQLCFKEICISGLIFLQSCWQKWVPTERSDAEQSLLKDIYDALVNEDWICAERLGLYAKEVKVRDQKTRLMLDVNYCQSLKWQGRNKDLEKEIQEFDISALSPIFKLAIHTLRSDRKRFYPEVKNAISVDKMDEKMFMEWPLFRELRKDPKYLTNIHAAFS